MFGSGNRPGNTGPSVTGSHTSTAAETSYTTVALTAPRSTKWKKLVITTSAGISIVQVQGNGPEFIYGNATPQVPGEIDLSKLPVSNTLDVGVENVAGVATTVVTAYY